MKSEIKKHSGFAVVLSFSDFIETSDLSDLEQDNIAIVKLVYVV